MTCKDCKYYELEMETGYGDYCDLHKFRFEGDIHICEQFEPKPTFFSRTPKPSTYTGSGGNSGPLSSASSGGGSRSSRKGCLVAVVILLVVAAILALMLLGTVRPVQSLDGTQDFLSNSNTLLKSFLPLTFPLKLV